MAKNTEFSNGDGSFVLFEKGIASNIPAAPDPQNSPYTDGKVYFDTDNSKLYIDADYMKNGARTQKRHLVAAANTLVDISDTDGNGRATITRLDGSTGTRALGKTYTAGNGINISGSTISAKVDNNTGENKLSVSTNGLYVPQATADKTNANQANKVWKTNDSGVPGWRDDANTVYTAGNGISITNGQIACTLSDTDTWQRNTKDQEGYVIKPPQNNDGSYLPYRVWKTNTEGVPNWRTVANILGTSAPTSAQDDPGLLIPTPPTGISNKKKQYMVLNALGDWVGLNDSDTITCRMFNDQLIVNDVNYGSQFTLLYPGDLVNHNYDDETPGQHHPQISFVSYHINSAGGIIVQSTDPVTGRTHWKCTLSRNFSSISGITGGGVAVWTPDVDARAAYAKPLDVSFRFDSDPRTQGEPYEPINVIYLDIYLDQEVDPFLQTTNVILDVSFIIIGEHSGDFGDNLKS